jgi:hypothetical protein
MMNSAGIAVQFSALPPGVVMILAAIAVPWIPHMARQAWMLAAIALSAWGLTTGPGEHFVWTALGYEFVLYRADALTLPFRADFSYCGCTECFLQRT